MMTEKNKVLCRKLCHNLSRQPHFKQSDPFNILHSVSPLLTALFCWIFTLLSLWVFWSPATPGIDWRLSHLHPFSNQLPQNIHPWIFLVHDQNLMCCCSSLLQCVLSSCFTCYWIPLLEFFFKDLQKKQNIKIGTCVWVLAPHIMTETSCYFGLPFSFIISRSPRLLCSFVCSVNK